MSRASATPSVRVASVATSPTFVVFVVAVLMVATAAFVAPAGATAASDAIAQDAPQSLSRTACPGSATAFPDVGSAHPFCVEIEWLAASGIGQGFPDGTFRPANQITRQALAAFLYRLAGEPAFSPPGSPTFSDVGVGHPFRTEIEWLADSGIGQGYADGTFRPTANITRQALAAFLYRYDGSPAMVLGAPTFSDVGPLHPFRLEIEWLADQGIGQGFPDGTFRPGNNITRQAVAAFLYRATDQWVVVANDGSIRTSRDTQRWVVRRSPGGPQLNAVASNHLGVWVAVGFEGTILRSTDGINWASVSSGTTQILWDIAHDGNGTMVAVGGGNGTVRRSTNTTTWSAVSTPTDLTLLGVAHDRLGRWLAVGSTGVAITSTDGTSWFSRTTNSPATLDAVAHDGATFVAVGGAARSTTSASNANVWDPVTTNETGYLNEIAHDGVGRWVTVGTAGSLRTSAGVTGPWSPIPSTTSEQLHGVDHGGGRWVVVGENGALATSSSGTFWIGFSTGTTAHLMGVAAIDR
ncbi:MAG: S-layer homology domain-containing protein [Acidimicrobiia bacterium]|nr:S-layer homology domain-containing protein [Acidimicrobiia bacterium]